MICHADIEAGLGAVPQVGASAGGAGDSAGGEGAGRRAWGRPAGVRKEMTFFILKKIFENEYNLANRYEFFNATTLKWNNIFNICFYVICSAEI